MSSKQVYRIRNWCHYNRALVNRGSLSVWLDEEVIQQWYSFNTAKRRGRPRTYSDLTIQAALIIKSVFHLPLRATQGLLESLLGFMGLNLDCPDYSTICRRQKDLSFHLTDKNQGHDTSCECVVVDSTGLKVFGEGEWKVRQYGYTKRRTWRKLHLAVDSNSHSIEAAAVSTNDFKDSELLPELLGQIEGSIERLCADGAYDSHEIYEVIEARGTKPIIPPRKGAVIAQHGNCSAPEKPRDKVVRDIKKTGRKKWKIKTGYHKRSLAETTMYRIKTIFGGVLRSRLFETQAVEALLKCHILNRMTSLGMPDSYVVKG